MPTNEVEHEEVIAMDREMWILRQLETSLTASADALARAAMIHHLQGVERWLRIALTETPVSDIPEDLNGPAD